MLPQGPTEEPIVLGLRAVFEAMVAEYSVVTRCDDQALRISPGLPTIA